MQNNINKQNVANKEGSYKNFTGIIDWNGIKANVKNAFFQLIDGMNYNILWKDGIWENGICKNICWENGIWMNGVLEEDNKNCNIWKKGVLKKCNDYRKSHLN